MYVCLGVTSHLHFWLNDRGLLRATAVTWGVERTLKKTQHTKFNSGEEKVPSAFAGNRARNLSITSPALLPSNYLSINSGHDDIDNDNSRDESDDIASVINSLPSFLSSNSFQST